MISGPTADRQATHGRRSTKVALWTAACLLVLGLAGCGLPASAPTASDLEKGQQALDQDIYIVKMTAPVAHVLGTYAEPGFPPIFRNERYSASIVLKPGDVVGVTVYESGGSPLFGGAAPPPTPGAPSQPTPVATTLPPQVVETDGRIIVPYVGRMRVAGLTPAQAASQIEGSLSSQTVRPQVIVSLSSNTSNTVAVGGEVNKAGLMQLTLRGERVLDAVAWAGGPKLPGAQLDVRLIRGTSTASVPLRNVLANPADNVVVRPNDNIVLVNNPRSFVVMGATAKVAQYPIDTEHVTFAEAIAKAGGGVDNASNMGGIYLFRYEPADFARNVLSADPRAVDMTYARTGSNGPSIPVMYRIDLKQAEGYFLAQQLPMRDKDIIVITTAEATQMQKFLTLLRGVTGLYFDLSRNFSQY
jgi:polysaccharide export outer membrane protein